MPEEKPGGGLRQGGIDHSKSSGILANLVLTSSRHLAEIILLALLMGLSWLTWQHAHVLHPDLSPIHLREEIPRLKLLSGQNLIQSHPVGPTALTLAAQPGMEKPCVEISLARWVGKASAHVRVKVTAESLIQGEKEWECGRVVIAWRDADGKILPGHYGLAGASENDPGENEIIVKLDKPGTPSILIQNLGQSGLFKIDELSIQPISMRPWVPWATAAMLLGLGFLMAAHFRFSFPKAKPGWARCSLAALLFVGAVWGLIFPGPWRPYHSIVLPFDLGPPKTPTTLSPEQSLPSTEPPAISHQPDEPSTIATTPLTATMPSASNAEVPGRMDGGWFWETYLWLKQKVRPLIHLGIFAGLAFLFRLLLGHASAWRPAALLALATEAMQFLFGFGFRWDDLLDLAINGLGILIGLRLATHPILAAAVNPGQK